MTSFQSLFLCNREKKYLHVNIHGLSSSSLVSKHVVKIAEGGGRPKQKACCDLEEFPPRRPTQEKLLAEKGVGRARVVSNVEAGEQAELSGAALEAWASDEALGGFWAAVCPKMSGCNINPANHAAFQLRLLPPVFFGGKWVAHREKKEWRIRYVNLVLFLALQRWIFYFNIYECSPA